MSATGTEEQPASVTAAVIVPIRPEELESVFAALQAARRIVLVVSKCHFPNDLHGLNASGAVIEKIDKAMRLVGEVAARDTSN